MRIRVSGCVVVFAIAVAAAGVWRVWQGGIKLSEVVDGVRDGLIMASAALLHEAGHAVAAWGCGRHIGCLRLDLFGARMKLEGVLSYRQELCVAAGGPIVNLLTAAMIYPLWQSRGGGTDGWFLALVASLGLGGLNLLPVRTMDGGRILACLLAPLCGDRLTEAILCMSTGLCLGALWLLAAYALLRVGTMLSLFVFCLCLLLRLTVSDGAG